MGLNKTVAVHSFIVLLFVQFVNNIFTKPSYFELYQDKYKCLGLLFVDNLVLKNLVRALRGFQGFLQLKVVILGHFYPCYSPFVSMS